MAICDKIRQFGRDNFSSMNEFAVSMQMSQPSLSQYLNGHREPGAGILKRLQNLGCDINWLLSEDTEGESPPENETEDKIKQLEAENKCLRDELSQVLLHAQAICNIEKIIDIKKCRKRQ